MVGRIRVLVIEDNVDAAEMFRDVLELSGHEVHLAHTAAEGLEMARAIRPHVVLCDVGLPGGQSGHGVARSLRADETMNETHLIALSGYGRPRDVRECLDAGFDEHMTKPVDLKSLIKRIAELVDTSSA